MYFIYNLVPRETKHILVGDSDNHTLEKVLFLVIRITMPDVVSL